MRSLVGIPFVVTLLLCCLQSFGSDKANVFPAAGEWSCFRRDGSLDAHSALKGDISNPAVAWKHFTGSHCCLTEVIPSQTDTVYSTPADSVVYGAYPPEDLRWGMSERAADIAGELQPIHRDGDTTYAKIFSEYPGLQKIEFENGFAKGQIGDKWQDCVGRCYGWKDGKWQLIWTTSPIQLLFQPLPLVGDFDGDGKKEVAVLPWNELLVLDANTGKIKDRCTFTEGRSYGFLGAYDLDHDGKTEFVVQADYCKHIDVLGYRNSKLSLLWRKVIELGFENPQKILRVRPDVAADVDSDGRLEVIVNLFNDTGDGKWHALVYDGIKGVIKADLPDEFINGLVDIDGDGQTEMLTTRTNGANVPQYGPIMIRKHDVHKGFYVAWQSKNSGWQEWERPLPPNVQSLATQGTMDVLYRRIGKQVIVALREKTSDGDRISLCKWNGKSLSPETSVNGQWISGLALDNKGNLLVLNIERPGADVKLELKKGTAKVLFQTPMIIGQGAVTVAQDPGDKLPTIMAQGFKENLIGFYPPDAGNKIVERWRIRGWGQSDAWDWGVYGPVVSELYGDGRRQHIYASTGPGGEARLVVSDLGGKELWHKDIPGILGGPPVWNIGGIIFWQIGHFTSKDRQDIIVTVRRSIMHSEETLLISSKDGRIIWRRAHEIDHRGVGGGAPFAITDVDGDGLDDLVSVHPNIFYALKGSTGTDIVSKIALYPSIGFQLYWGLPIAGDFKGNGTRDILYTSKSGFVTGLLDSRGSLLWSDAVNTSPKTYPAVGNFNGDGKLDVVGIGYSGGGDNVRCYDGATGKVKWQLSVPLDADVHGTASADVNSDGRDEAIFTSGNTLYCVGAGKDGKSGTLLWKISLSEKLGPPTIAYLGGKSKMSILVSSRDGYVYCIE